MKKTIVEEIEFDDSGKWSNASNYPHQGLFLVKLNSDSSEKVLIENKSGIASWFGIIDEQFIKEEFHSKQESLDPPKSSEVGVRYSYGVYGTGWVRFWRNGKVWWGDGVML